MRVLILGGSWFLGRAVATAAMARGWQVTALTRGRTGTPPTGVEHVRGDRHDAVDLRRLHEVGPWDATIDTSAYAPVDVASAVEELGADAGRYALISTVSVYRDRLGAPVDESSPVLPGRADAKETDRDVLALPEAVRYGSLKVGCELAAKAAPGGTLIVRPGVILGPGEYIGRAGALLERARRGGRWLVPAPSDRPIQPVDVRDVATFVLDGVEAGSTDLFNLTAPAGHATYGELIEHCVALTGHRARPVWVDPLWLAARGVRQWTEIPLWHVDPGVWAVDSTRAHRAGFRCRPLGDTLADFMAAADVEPPVAHPRATEHGMDPGREAALLAAWDAQSNSAGR